MMRGQRWSLAVSAGVAVACAAALCASYMLAPSRPKAVFLIVVDALRPDRLSCYGYQAHETPNIDSLAVRGVTFARAHSVASWTVPSMGAMLTSLYPTQLGLVERPAPPGTRFKTREKRRQSSYSVPTGARTLAEIMRDAGYRTAGFVNQPLLNSGPSFLRGFVDWFCPVSPDKVGLFDRNAPRKEQWKATMRNTEVFDPLIIREFDRWLAKNSNARPFAWVHLLTPHRPYFPPPRYRPRKSGTRTRRYDGEVRVVDDMIGTILTSIDRHVGLEDSLIIFTSDHGEAFGEHGMEEHGHSLHREVVRVPLIITSHSLPSGRTVDTYVRTIDILPTVLDIIGKSSLTPASAEGLSLMAMLREGRTGRPVFSEGMLYGSTERSILVEGFKLMYDMQDEHYALYDVVSDPEETVNLASQRPDQTARLRKALQHLHSRLKDDHLRLRQQHVVTEQVEDPEEDERTLEALRSLGYIGD